MSRSVIKKILYFPVGALAMVSYFGGFFAALALIGFIAEEIFVYFCGGPIDSIKELTLAGLVSVVFICIVFAICWGCYSIGKEIVGGDTTAPEVQETKK